MATQTHPHGDTPKRDRRAENWSFDDTRALFEAAVSRRHILKAQFGSKVKPADKDRAWDEIVECVNAVGLYKRNRKGCEDKLRCYISQTKTKLRKLTITKHQTGSAADDVKPLPESTSDNSTLRALAVSFDGPEKTLGYPGGLESSLHVEDEKTVEARRLAGRKEALDKQQAMRTKVNHLIEKSQLKQSASSTLVDSNSEGNLGNSSTLYQPISPPQPSMSTGLGTPRNPFGELHELFDTPSKRIQQYSSGDSLSNYTPAKRRSKAHGITLQELKDTVGPLCGKIDLLQDEISHLRADVKRCIYHMEGREVSYTDEALQTDVVPPQPPISLNSMKALLSARINSLLQSGWQEVVTKALTTKTTDLQQQQLIFSKVVSNLGQDGEGQFLMHYETTAPSWFRQLASEVRFRTLVLIVHQMAEDGVISLPNDETCFLTPSASRGAEDSTVGKAVLKEVEPQIEVPVEEEDNESEAEPVGNEGKNFQDKTTPKRVVKQARRRQAERNCLDSASRSKIQTVGKAALKEVEPQIEVPVQEEDNESEAEPVGNEGKNFQDKTTPKRVVKQVRRRKYRKK